MCSLKRLNNIPNISRNYINGHGMYFATPALLDKNIGFFWTSKHFACILPQVVFFPLIKVYLKRIKEHCKLKKMSIFFNTVPTCGKALTKQHTD